VKTVASFREPYQAHLAKGKLESEGIYAVVLDEHLVQINWILSQAIGGVKVQVSDEHLDRARVILKTEYKEELSATQEAQLQPAPEDVCPKCGSSSVSPKRYSRWFLIPSLLLLFPIFFRRKQWVCNDCGATW
jgi:ribosomal protein S27AE